MFKKRYVEFGNMHVMKEMQEKETKKYNEIIKITTGRISYI